MKKAIFLDRDGTLNIDKKGYISSPQDFQLFDFAKEALEIVDDYFLFLVTNQSGIARGYFDFDDLQKVHTEMNKQLGKPMFDDILISPFHEDGTIEKYAIKSETRKPGISLFKKTLQNFEFRINESFMIGDKMSDIEFGYNAGLQTILVLTGNGERVFKNRKNWKVKPDYVVKNLLYAMKLIKKINKKSTYESRCDREK